jgi:hypothetical protein
LRTQAADDSRSEQLARQGAQIEAAIEAVGNGAEVVVGVLAVAEGVVRWFDRKKLPTRNRSFVRIPDLFHHEGHEEHQEIR